MTPKPCPFCGGTDVSVIEGSTFRWRKVRCNDCDAECGEVRIKTSGTGTLNEWEEQAHFDAFKEWNTRYEEGK